MHKHASNFVKNYRFRFTFYVIWLTTPITQIYRDHGTIAPICKRHISPKS